MKICGPKLSLCGLILSIWGIIQLTLMGIFYYVHSVALIEDLPVQKKIYTDPHVFFDEADKAYKQNAINCWIAAGIYAFILLVSIQQFHANRRAAA